MLCHLDKSLNWSKYSGFFVVVIVSFYWPRICLFIHYEEGQHFFVSKIGMVASNSISKLKMIMFIRTTVVNQDPQKVITNSLSLGPSGEI